MTKATCAWLLYLSGFILLVAQEGVAGVLAAVGVQTPTWFLVLHLPQELRTAGLVVLAVLGVLAIIGGRLLTRAHDKPARQRFHLP